MRSKVLVAILLGLFSIAGNLSVTSTANAQLLRKNCCQKCQQNDCCCPTTGHYIPSPYNVPPVVTSPLQGQIIPTPTPGMTTPSVIQPVPGEGNTGDGKSLVDPNQYLPSGQTLTAPTEQPVAANTIGQSTFQPTFAQAATMGGAGEAIGGADTMIGDFFSTGAFIGGPTWGDNFTLPMAGGDRRQKWSEHASPFPRNRVFFNYNIFGDAVTDSLGNNFSLTRYTFGLERTFNNQNQSFEVRVPFSYGLDSDQLQPLAGEGRRLGNSEFGNITFISKALLYRDARTAWAIGTASTLPTADDAFAEATNGTTVLVENEAFRLQPYMAFNFQPRPCGWMTFYSGAEFALNGNTVNVNDGQIISEFNDQHLFMIDLSFGRWLYKACEPCNRLQGVAGIIEFHYTTTLNDTDVVQAGTIPNTGFNGRGGGFDQGDTLANPFNRLDVLNMTSGLRFNFNNRTMVTLAGVVPLRALEERVFDAEFSLQLSRLF